VRHEFIVITDSKGQLHPETSHESPKGERRYISTLPLTSALDEGEWLTPRAVYFILEIPIVEAPRWAPGPVWTGAENLALAGFRSTDRPARSNRQ
jgi:hypothetical protein